MEEEKKAILTVALDDETFERIAPLLKRRSLTVSTVSQGSEAEKLAKRRRYHLVICRYPLPDMKLREFVASIRSESSSSKSASLMLLTIPEMATEAQSGVRGVGAGGPMGPSRASIAWRSATWRAISRAAA